jgi:hypothetical protein
LVLFDGSTGLTNRPGRQACGTEAQLVAGKYHQNREAAKKKRLQHRKPLSGQREF